MFKNTVVSISVGIATLLSVQACSLSEFSMRQEPSEALQLVIAKDLVNLLSRTQPAQSRTLFLDVDASEDWFYEAFSEVLRARGYSIAVNPSTATTLSVSMADLGANAYHIVLVLADGPRFERIYQIENSGQSLTHDEAGSANTPLTGVARRADVPPQPSHDPKTTVLRDQSTAKTNVHESVPMELDSYLQPATFSPCVDSTLQPGSLKQNLKQIFQVCGWQIVSWPRDPKRVNHEIDWIVSTPTELESSSIEDLAATLLGIGLVAELDYVTKTARISLRN